MTDRTSTSDRAITNDYDLVIVRAQLAYRTTDATDATVRTDMTGATDATDPPLETRQMRPG